MTVTNALTALDNFIREELPRVINESLPQIAPVFSDIESSSIDVVRNEGIGRGWKVIHLFSTGVAGLIEYANPAGPAMLGGSSSDNLSVLNPVGTDFAPFPTASESPHTGNIKRELTLHKMVGNFSIPIEWLQLDALSATQIKQVAKDIKAVGELRAITEAASLFGYAVANAGGYMVDVLGRISAIAEKGSTDYINITLNETYGRIHNFRPGMRIDVVADSSGVIQTGTDPDGTDVRNYTHTTNVYVWLIVDSVDYLNKIITLRPIHSVLGTTPNYGSGSSGDVFAVAAAANDWLVVSRCSRYTAGTRPLHSWGFEDWLKGSGLIMGGAALAGGLDLDTFPQFKSQVVAVNGPLTDTVMNTYLGGYLDSYPGVSLDTIITTTGVTQKYIEQASLYNNRMIYDRTGKALSIAGGWQTVGYSFNGRELKWIVNPMGLKNRLYALKLAGGNIKRYVPPKIGGADARIGNEIEFVGPLTGHSGIFLESRSSTGAVQGFIEAPFWQYKLIAPIDVRGCKFTDVTEA